jgi:hypothetical protein
MDLGTKKRVTGLPSSQVFPTPRSIAEQELTTNPNVANRMCMAPSTTNHARHPPSGKVTTSPSDSLTSASV